MGNVCLDECAKERHTRGYDLDFSQREEDTRNFSAPTKKAPLFKKNSDSLIMIKTPEKQLLEPLEDFLGPINFNISELRNMKYEPYNKLKMDSSYHEDVMKDYLAFCDKNYEIYKKLSANLKVN